MCGIIGYISKKDKAYVNEKAHFMRFALALDTLRGQDSTGIMTVHNKFHVDTLKSLMPGDRFVQSERFRKKWTPGWAQVGHNRAATHGKVKIDNAHPFLDGPVALVHNGTLWAAGRTLPRVNDKLEVDSAQIAHNFAEHDPEEADAVLSEIDGAFALVWFDARDKSINMARNSDRPLHYAVGKQRDIMWFMSDGAHLQTINKSMEKSQAAGHSVFLLEKHLHLKWKKGKLVPEVSNFDPFVHTQRNNSSTFKGKGNTTTKTSSTTSQKEKSGSDKTALERATEAWEKNVKAYNGRNGNSAGFRPPRVKLAGHMRLVPKPMLKVLQTEYELDQGIGLKFTPEEHIELTTKDHMVIGSIEHPGWGNCEWKAVVMNASKTMTQAYMGAKWKVRPIGVGLPWDEGTHECPSLLCHVEHCAWDKEEAQEMGKVIGSTETPSNMSTEDSGDDSDSGFVAGPQQIMLPLKRAQDLLENGCVSCGYASTIGELSECQLVNEGRDLICPGCVEELKESIPH